MFAGPPIKIMGPGTTFQIGAPYLHSCNFTLHCCVLKNARIYAKLYGGVLKL